MVINYDVFADTVIQALIAEAKADPDVIGLVLLGSRAIGGVGIDSDYDVMFVVTDEAAARYATTQMEPARGTTVIPPIDTTDIGNESPGSLQAEKIVDWMLPAFAECLILYDRTGETAPIIHKLSRMPADHAQQAIPKLFDAYLNGLYRSLKAWRRGLEFGARMEAAETANALLHLLYALDMRWRPYSSRLVFHLDRLNHQGWQPGELQAILLDLISTGHPQRQQALARRVIPMLQERGFGRVYDEWNGEIDEALSWEF